METNPRSLQSNLKPLKPYPSWFFHNRHSCLLKKQSLGTPPPQNKLHHKLVPSFSKPLPKPAQLVGAGI